MVKEKTNNPELNDEKSINVEKAVAEQTDFMSELQEFTESRLKGPPPMRELTPAEDIQINKETQVKDKETGQVTIDTEARIRRKINKMLDGDIEDVAKTVTQYQDIMERFIYLMGSTSQRIDFLRGKKLGDKKYLELIRRS